MEADQEEDQPKIIPVSDLKGLTPFCLMHKDCDPELQAQGTRVTAFFPANARFYELCARFNDDETLVPLQSFLAAQRAIYARMQAMKKVGAK